MYCYKQGPPRVAGAFRWLQAVKEYLSAVIWFLGGEESKHSCMSEEKLMWQMLPPPSRFAWAAK